MKKVFTTLLFSGVLLAQVRHDYIVIPSGGTFNAGSATRTAPVKVGTSLPGTCTTGDFFYKSDATAGQNLYSCTSTNTWTQHTGAGGGGDASTNASSSVDSELALFSGTGGKTLKRATTTGLLKGTSGVVSAAVAGTDYVVPAGNVATATALAANPANCSAGQVPLGVNAQGAVEGCFTPSGSGDVTGPGSAVSGNAASFSGTSGKTIADSGKALPSGTIVGTTDTQSLNNKTLNNPIISTILNIGTITLPTDTTTLVGRNTTDALDNKTLNSPVINTPTGLLKSDVGLSNVDNTADSAKSIAASQLTGNMPDARIVASNVTQHQASLSIGASQLTGSIADARVQASNVTQHQAALSIGASQLTGTLADARVAASNVTQHQAALSIGATQLTGSIADARVPASNVTQHQAALALSASQTTSGVFAIGRIATGTPDGTKFVRDDGTLAVPPGGSAYTDTFSYTDTAITVLASTHGKGQYPTAIYKDEDGLVIRPFSESINGDGDITFTFASATDGTLIVK